jgi:hypothetical protein
MDHWERLAAGMGCLIDRAVVAVSGFGMVSD